MKNQIKFQLLAFVLLTGLFFSCSSDNDPTPIYPSLKGAFLINEGGFNKNNGTISFYGTDGTIDKDIFRSVNGKVLGDIVQDFEIVDTLGFIVVNNSKRVEIVRMRDFKSVGTINDEIVTYPRFVVQATDKTVYITNGAKEGEVLVFDFKQMSIVDRIAVGKGPEMMVKVGNKMYVANSGGWSVDNTISVIDITAGKVVKTIVVDEGSVTLKLDSENNVWVYSKGKADINYVYTSPKIFKINTNTDEVQKQFDLPASVGTYGSNLLTTNANGEVFYLSDALYKMNIDATELPVEKFVDVIYYGIEADPVLDQIYAMNSDNNEVIILNGSNANEVNKLVETMPYSRSVVINR